MTIEGLETYILQPRDPVDFDLHRFQREVLCSGGCDRGVSVPGHQVATVL
jgi:hypothetical protein